MSDYYQENYKAYHERTFAVDPSSFLAPFARRLTQGALILDVGCGSGRDLLWLKKRGLKVIGFERSEGLADLARKHVGCQVIRGDFETFDFSEMSVDAILLSGAFVHLPHGRLSAVFHNVMTALRSNTDASRYLYISLKEGKGTCTDTRGRTFYLWQDSALRKLFAAQRFSVMDFNRSASVLGTGEAWLGYVLEKDRMA